MITRMEIVSSLPGAPELPLGGFMPNTDPVQIRDIAGLGPVKADVASTPFATGRGELFQGGSTGKRNIVLTLGLNPNWIDQTVMALRQLLYRYFMPERWAKLRFFSDELPVAYINGVVESVEPNIFAQDPEIQVSILCPKPDFIEAEATLITGTTTGILDDPPAPVIIDYEGTVPVGFELHIESSDDVDEFTGEVLVTNTIGDLYQEIKAEAITVNSAMYFQLNTVRTTRHLYNVIVASSEEINVLAKMEKDSTWPEFSPGENALVIATTEPGLNWTLGYFNRFGGF